MPKPPRVPCRACPHIGRWLKSADTGEKFCYSCIRKYGILLSAANRAVMDDKMAKWEAREMVNMMGQGAQREKMALESVCVKCGQSALGFATDGTARCHRRECVDWKWELQVQRDRRAVANPQKVTRG